MQKFKLYKDPWIVDEYLLEYEFMTVHMFRNTKTNKYNKVITDIVYMSLVEMKP